MIGEESGSGWLVTRITVTYRVADDPKAGERTVSLVHGAGGAEVDGVIWSDDLVRRLAYLEGEGCVVPKKLAGRDAWRVEADSTGAGAPCYWVHRNECTWEEYCPDQ